MAILIGRGWAVVVRWEIVVGEHGRRRAGRQRSRDRFHGMDMAPEDVI